MDAYSPARDPWPEVEPGTLSLGSDSRKALPLACLESGPGGHEPATLHARAPSALLVEDDLYVVQFLDRVLTHLGLEVVLAFGGSQAVARFEQRHDDLGIVLLDLGLPRQDGFAVLDHFRGFDSSVPVVIISGYSDLEIKQRASAAGAAEYLTKPFGRAELEAALRRWGRRLA